MVASLPMIAAHLTYTLERGRYLSQIDSDITLYLVEGASGMELVNISPRRGSSASTTHAYLQSP